MKKQIAVKVGLALGWLAVGFFLIAFTAEAGSLFQPAVDYDVGGYPQSVAIGGLNGDTAPGPCRSEL